MPDENMSTILDNLRAKRNGVEQHDEPTPEQIEAQRKAAEDAAFERMAKGNESKLGRDRIVNARRAMIGATTSLRHGAVLDAEDRAALVEEVVAGIGGKASPNQRKVIEQAVSKMADLVADGMKGDAVQVAEDAAADLAEGVGSIGKPAPVADDESPMSLAAQIPRG
jgi:hypothetical protein